MKISIGKRAPYTRVVGTDQCIPMSMVTVILEGANGEGESGRLKGMPH
jgi:hypothetical protein